MLPRVCQDLFAFTRKTTNMKFEIECCYYEVTHAHSTHALAATAAAAATTATTLSPGTAYQ